MYNLTNLTENVTNPAQQITALNDLSGGVLSLTILATIFILSFMIVKNRPDSDLTIAWIAASASSLFIGILMWGIRLLPQDQLIYPLVCLILGIILYMIRE